MNILLNCDIIQDQLCRFSQKQPTDHMNPNEAYKILNQMSQKNGYQEFNYDVAAELFDRIQTKYEYITMESLAYVFSEVNELLSEKYAFLIDCDMQLQESKAFLRVIRPYGDRNHIKIDSIAYQSRERGIRPYVIASLGDNLIESQVGQYSENEWYTFAMGQSLPVQSLLDDLKIQIFHERQVRGHIQLQCECLPFDEVREATLPLYNEGIEVNERISIACQLVLGNDYKELIQQKLASLDEKSKLYSEEMYILEQQLKDLCKPFLTPAQIKVSPKGKLNSQQHRYSGPRFSEQDQLDPPASFNRTSQTPNQHDLFQPSKDYKNSLDYRPSISASVFKPQTQNSKQSVEHNQEAASPWGLLSRLDLLMTVNLVFSMLTNFWIFDFLSGCSLLTLSMSIMLKRTNLLYLAIFFILLNITYDIVHLSICYFNVLQILVLMVAIILKILTFFGGCLVVLRQEHLCNLKSKFLKL